MVKKAKKKHFRNINLSEITDNKKFWKTGSHIFGKTIHKINLIKKKCFSNLDEEIPKTFKEYCDQIVAELNIIKKC